MPTEEWFTQFFQGVATDLWRRFTTPEMTAAEVSFFVEALHLEEGQRILDVPSGNGRHAIAMAQCGFDVTGVDISEEMLAFCRQHIWDRLRFESHDMRALPYERQFDAAFCAGNSFGYFVPADTQRFLDGIARALKPGGRFLIDTDMAAETYLVTGGVKEWVQADDIIMLIKNEYVPLESRLDSELTYLQKGQVEKRSASHYIHTIGEIVRMLAAAGLTAEETYSTTDGDVFEIGAERLFLVARKN